MTLVSHFPRPGALTRASLTAGLVSLIAALGGCFSHSLGFKSSADESLYAPAPAQRLTIHNIVGQVTLHADPDATGVSVEVEKIGKGSSQKEADRALSEISVALTPDPSDASALQGVVTHPRSMRRRAYQVNWIVTAPPSVTLDIQTDVGEITAEGFTSGADFESDVGEITVRNFSGPVTIRTDVGDVLVTTDGPISVRTDVGNVVAHAMGTDPQRITIRTDVGNVSLHIDPQWRGSVRAETDVGNVSLGADVAGVHALRQSHRRFDGRIGDASGGAEIEISTDVGQVMISDAAGAPDNPDAGQEVQ